MVNDANPNSPPKKKKKATNNTTTNAAAVTNSIKNVRNKKGNKI